MFKRRGKHRDANLDLTSAPSLWPGPYHCMPNSYFLFAVFDGIMPISNHTKIFQPDKPVSLL